MGMSPYEKRLLDMLKVSGASADKRMYKFAKRRVSYNTLFLTNGLILKFLFFSLFLLFSWVPTQEP